MKQFIVITALLLLANPVFAQGVRVKVEGEANSVQVKTRSQSEMEMRKASSTQRKVDLHLNVARERAGKVLRGLNATAERLERIIERVESRISKVRADGGVVTESETAIASAKNHLSQAKASISAYASIQFTASSTVRENFQQVKSAAAEAKMHLRETHKALVEAIRSLKPGQAMKRATTTNN